MENLSPLVEPLHYKIPSPYKSTIYKTPIIEAHKQKNFEGPKRALRLCLMGIILPGLLISVPLYLKHRVYDYQVYPVGMSDMRLIDSRVSTTWCQRQVLKSNATFNAFLLKDAPDVSTERKAVKMTRHLKLSDDMKEYWGFYLLKGSVVTVSTCARWPGSSLILIRGHRHLHECAYIGDDSSEEYEELMEIAAEGGVNYKVPKSEESPSNRVDQLEKHRPEVTFHGPRNNTNKTSVFEKEQSTEDENINTKQMKELLSLLAYKAERANTKGKIPDEHRNERFKKLKHEILSNARTKKAKKVDNGDDYAIMSSTEKLLDFTQSQVQNQSSRELMHSVVDKLRLLGEKGERVLELLKKESALTANENAIKEAKRLGGKQTDEFSMEMLNGKRKSMLQEELNIEDEEELNLGGEANLTPDELADDHQVINETTLNDRSNSEFWSSFSSSEEALLNCAGLILSLPLTSNRMCAWNASSRAFDDASLPNKISYNVPRNGYYFFVFNSENEVQENYIRVHFNLEKTMYNVTDAKSTCNNTSDRCEFPLKFFSNEKVVFELPVRNNESLWNEEFILTSECEPRTAIYLICVLTVPLLILFFAFQ